MAKVVLTAHDLQEAIEQKNPNLHLEYMLRKFKKQVETEGILEECRRREFFLKKSIQRKEKSKRAKIREIKANKNRKKVL